MILSFENGKPEVVFDVSNRRLAVTSTKEIRMSLDHYRVGEDVQNDGRTGLLFAHVGTTGAECYGGVILITNDIGSREFT